jgi:RNA polymerase sigma-70 factor (ECF subfamily)
MVPVGHGLEAVVHAARRGDREAFAALVRATCDDTYTLAYRLTGDEEDARDVVQEAYLRAYRGIGRFRGEAQVTTWLYRITANCAANHLRAKGRRRHLALDDTVEPADAAPAADPLARVLGLDLRDTIEAAIAELPPGLRAVVVLRDVYGLPHEAIAAELGISEAAAKVRLHRARRALRTACFPARAEEADRAV